MQFITLTSKKNKFCIFQIFAAIFHFKLWSFCWQGVQIYFLPQAQGTLATPLYTRFL